jgi:parallel beta-helix repeat protein
MKNQITGDEIMKNKIFVTLMCLTLALSTFVMTADDGSNVEGKEGISVDVTYIVSAPFRINSNVDFSISPKVSGGDGSAGNPWVIENFEINGTGYGYCIYIGNTTEHFIIRNCLLHNASGFFDVYFYWDSGLVLHQVQNGEVVNCTVFNCERGMYISMFSNNILAHKNSANFNRNSGFYICDNSYNNTIANNTAYSNINGIDISNVNSLFIYNNSLINNTGQGLLLQDSYVNHVERNNASLNGGAGIEIRYGRSQKNVIFENVAHQNGHEGIKVLDCFNNALMNNSISRNPHGLSITNSEFMLVQGNEIQNNSIGLLMLGGNQNRVFNNVINKSKSGLFLHSSTNNYFGENSIFNSTGMTGSSVYSSLETDINVYQNDVDWSAYSSFEEQLAIGDGGNPLFTKAVELADTILFEVNITGHPNAPDLDLAIFLDGKDGNPIDGITQTGEFVDYCADADADESVRMLAPENGTYLIRVFGFTLTANPGQFDIDINIINATSTGIFLLNSTFNKIANCNISDNTHGLNFTQSSNYNTLYYNNIGNNTVQAHDDGINFWNTSYPTGGNFWSNYVGVDAFKGFNQNIAGSDGIGDTPYIGILGTGNHDEYPLKDYTDGVYIDITPPTSSAYLEEDEPFWGYCVVSTNLDDDYSGINETVMWYRYSSDNQTWGNWIEFTFYQPNKPSWVFSPIISSLGDEGYYEFYTIATDGAGNIETKPQIAEAYWLLDNTAPQSHVLQPTDYWNKPNLEMEVNVTDNTNSTQSVEVYYRISLNNATWGTWMLFKDILAEPWNFTFDFPDGQGYYQFYSIANETSGNREVAPAIADAISGYDVVSPGIVDLSSASGATGDTYTFRANVSDNINLSEVRVVYRFGTGNETNATFAHVTNNNYQSGIIPLISSLEMLHYKILAVDDAGNWNSTIIKNILIVDNDNPIADAGPSQIVNVNSFVTFNGSASTDNIGVTNYTWTFNDSTGNITHYGVSPTHNFTVSGNFTVSLNVTDAAGNWDTDTVLIIVAEHPVVDITAPEAHAGPDQTVTLGTSVTFDGSTSIDNVGIANYTWTFTHNSTSVTLYGVSPTFRFWEVGNHTVTLNVSDAAGNWNTGTMRVEVTETPVEAEEPGNYIWFIVITIVIFVVVILGFWLMKGRKQKTPKPPES